MYNPVTQLNNIFPKEPGSYQFSDSKAVHSMVLMREILESTNQKETYQTLNLYCNWIVHSEIEGTKAGFRMLDRISKVLHLDNRTLDDIISKEISLLTLRNEILGIFIINNISTELVDSIAGWEIFGGHFLKAILNKKLMWPNNPDIHKRSHKIFNKMKEDFTLEENKLPKSLRLGKNPTGNSNNIKWIIELFDGSELTGQLRNLEDENNFSHHSFKT